MVSVKQSNFKKTAIKTLLVEDDEDLMDITAELLELSGCLVTAVATPAEALQCLKEEINNFDLLFTDYRFPSALTGLDLADQVRRAFPHIKVIIATGFDPQAFQDQNTNHYSMISKPYRLDVLKELIQQLFSPQLVHH